MAINVQTSSLPTYFLQFSLPLLFWLFVYFVFMVEIPYLWRAAVHPLRTPQSLMSCWWGVKSTMVGVLALQKVANAQSGAPLSRHQEDSTGL